MGNFERGLVLAAAMMAEACDDTARSKGIDYDAGCYGDGGSDSMVCDFDAGDFGVDAAKDLGVRDTRVLADGRVVDAEADAALNGEFLCDDNRDCRPLQYCHEIDERARFCRDNPHGPNDNVGVGMACSDNNNCLPTEYCHIDNGYTDSDLDGARCLENPNGEIPRPDGGVDPQPGRDAGNQPPSEDAMVSQPPRPDADVVDRDGAVVADGGENMDTAIVSADGGVSEAGINDGGDASDASSDAADAENDTVIIGPLPPLPDAVVDAANDAGVSTDVGDLTDVAGDVSDASSDAADAEDDAIIIIGPLPDAANDAASEVDAADDAALQIDAANDAAPEVDAADDAALQIDAANDAAPEVDAADDVAVDAAALPGEPCGGPCPPRQACDPIENVCAPECNTNDDCPPEERCLDADTNMGVCVKPDFKLTLDPGHVATGISGMAMPGKVRGSWNVPARQPYWSANLDLGEHAAGFVVTDSADAVSAYCGNRVRCELFPGKGLSSRVPLAGSGLAFGPDATIQIPDGPAILTVEIQRGAAAALNGQCILADNFCR